MKLFLAWIFLLVAVPGWCVDDFGIITELKGTVMIRRTNGKVMPLNRDKHLLRVVRVGEEIETGIDGWVKVAALQGSQLFELHPETNVIVQTDSMKTVKGKVDIRKGFPVPTRIGDRPIGAVILGSTMRGGGGDCLGKVRPFNEASTEQIIRVVWQNFCDEEREVKVSIFDPVGKAVLQATTDEKFVDIPNSTLSEGTRYTITFEQPGGGNSLSGFLRVIDKGERAELDRRRSASRTADQNGRIEFLLYLMVNEMYGEAKNEVARLQKEFPGNDYLKGLATYLNSLW